MAMLAGVLLAFAAAPHEQTSLLFAWSFLLARAIEGTTPREAAKLGLLCGFSCHAIAFHWVTNLYSGHVPIPVPVALVLAMITWAGQSLPMAVGAGLARTIPSPGGGVGVGLAIAVPVGFGLVPMVFPWRPAEVTPGFPALAQLADISGPSLLDFVVTAIGAFAHDATRGRRPYGPLALSLLVGTLAYGHFRIADVSRQEASAPRVRLGLVQPHVPQQLKFDPRLAPSTLDRLRALSEDVERRGAEVVIWPETSYPSPLPRDLDADLVGRRGIRHRGRVTRPVIFGAVTEGGVCDHRNTVFALDDEGRIASAVDKVALFPFSERIPFHAHLTVLHGILPCPGFRPGDALHVLPIAGLRPGILNCYEDLLTGPTRDLVAREAPEFLLNLTNDTWFFDTAEPHLHHMVARLRAVETHRPLVRVVNSGVTGHIDASGRAVASLPVWQSGTLVVEVPRLGGESLYVRFGDVATPAFEALACSALLALLIAEVRAKSGARRS